MELRKFGEPIWRQQVLPFCCPPVPSVLPSWRRFAAHQKVILRRTNHNKRTTSGIHTTAVSHAKPSSDSSTADPDFLEDKPQKDSRNPRPTSASSSRRSSDESTIDNLIKSTLGTPNLNRRKQASTPSSSTASMVDSAFKANQYYNMRDRGARSPGSLAASMNFPNAPGASDASVNKYRSQGTIGAAPARRAKRTIRSRPSVGRTVELNPDREVDFGRALRTLDIQCAVNRVRQDLARQRFHERPGMKRKRLKSERWRKLFRESFRATVGRVKEMRRKGW